MSKHFNEDTRVKFPATVQFLRLGYNYLSLKEANIDFNTKIFIDLFKSSLEKINSLVIQQDELNELISDISRMIKNNDLGKEFYKRLLSSEYPIKLIDFDNIENNNFTVVDELPFSIKQSSEEGSFRPDINVLINGIPLAFLEVKKPNNEGGIQVEFDRMINKRLKNDEYKKFFNMIQIVSFSNNMEYEECDDALEVKAGSFYTTPNGFNTTFSFFREDISNYHSTYNFKEIDENTIKNIVSDNGYNPNEVDTPEFQYALFDTTPCNRFITSLFDKERFIYFLHYGIMYLTQNKKIHNDTLNKDEEYSINQKHIMRYPQFFATRAILKRLDQENKNGIIWHTQGSGKTALSAFSCPIISDYFAKKKINARFFFIVDRLDLMRQATNEFTNRGFNVINVSSKKEFDNELNKTLNDKNDGIGTICIVNIHKISESDNNLPSITNDYNVKVQRIFFVDEAHRSYSSHGEFYKNLMTCDVDGIYFAMTGTPLLTKSERSNLKFGDYIHKYFYDKSIADGYTLKIKKEQIDTIAKAEIRNDLKLENRDLNSADVYESNDYINSVSKYIEKDFKNFRLGNSDSTIGSMIVCRSNFQAKQINEWFKKHSDLKTGLVLSDNDNEGDIKQSKLNKEYQISFRETNFPDILVVHFMLTTGYDVKRLKKMYLLRGPKAQNLLQTISRVNRPYKNENGKVYQYGYIVDFIDIEKEYEETINAYRRELENNINDDGDDECGSISSLVIGVEDIKEKFDKLKEQLKQYIKVDNIEIFARSFENNSNKDEIYKVRKLLLEVKNCLIEFKLSRANEYISLIDGEKLEKYIKTINNIISFKNLTSNPINALDIMNNDEIINIIYTFTSNKFSILDLGEFTQDADYIKLKTTITNVQNEIKNNKNKNDIRIKKLSELLRKVFEKLQFVNKDNISTITQEFEDAYEDAKKINIDNEETASLFNGKYAFVKTLTDTIEDTNLNKEEMEELFILIQSELHNTFTQDDLVFQGKKGFIDMIKEKITPKLVKKNIKLYTKISPNYDEILTLLYTNLLDLKESI